MASNWKKQKYGSEPLNEKWSSFGWHTQEIDGHDIKEIQNALQEAKNMKPSVIIAYTIKGKGVSFMYDKIGTIEHLMLKN